MSLGSSNWLRVGYYHYFVFTVFFCNFALALVGLRIFGLLLILNTTKCQSSELPL